MNWKKILSFGENNEHSLIFQALAIKSLSCKVSSILVGSLPCCPWQALHFIVAIKILYSASLTLAVLSLSHVWLFSTPRAAAPRLPCPAPSPGVCSNSCLLRWWCYLTISSSVAPSSSPQSFPASGSFPVTHLFTSSGQSIGLCFSKILRGAYLTLLFYLQI